MAKTTRTTTRATIRARAQTSGTPASDAATLLLPAPPASPPPTPIRPPPAAKRARKARARTAKAPGRPTRSAAAKSPADAVKAFDRVALIFQGGGALGAYQAGVYQGLNEAKVRPDWIAGISVGAFNAAILAGNPPETRVERLREFWTTICRPAVLPHSPWLEQMAAMFPGNPELRSLASLAAAGRALVEGQNGFFLPRMPPPWMRPPGSATASSWYDTAPLKQTLERLVDFDRLNHGNIRVSVGAVNVRTGNFVYFDTTKMRLRAEHIMASGALPPGFPAIEIEGEHYWDGGIISNTPLAYVMREGVRQNLLAFQVDLWSSRGKVPSTIVDVLEREKDIRYSSRTRMVTNALSEAMRMRRAIGWLLDHMPKGVKRTPRCREIALMASHGALNVVHLIYRTKGYETHAKDYEFSESTMLEHWQTGHEDIVHSLARPDYLRRPAPDEGVVTHDIHRETRPMLGG